MPIRINFLAEAQAAEELRRKDPVKRSIWVGGFVVFLALLWAGTLQLKIISERSAISALQASWKNIETKVNLVQQHKKLTRDIEGRLSALDQFTTNRMLWANTLDALQHTMVDNVQIVRLKTEQTFQRAEPVKAPVDVAAAAAAAAAAARAATVTERAALILEGRDYSARLGDQIPKFKQALLDAPYFAANLQKTNKVQLTSLSAPQSEGNRSFVSFGYQVFFQDKERRLHE